jgi:hypothetical protein
VSFTHLIAYALTRAVATVRAMNSGFGLQDGKPVVVHHDHLNLGIAVDVERPDGTRSLLVPNIKHADEMDFAEFFAAYEELIRKVRTNKLAPEDFAGTTATITNPGMIGTVHSVPRLMPGQGFIIGVGTIAYPAEYEGADPQTIARLAVSKVFTLTSTYDHRIIGGAESAVPAAMHQLLQGNDGFYDEIFRSFDVPYEPALEYRRQPVGRSQHRVREGRQRPSARQHVPGARSPDRQPRSARPPPAAHAPRARREPLRPVDLGPRPRVPGGRSRFRRARAQDHAVARHPRHPARCVLTHDRRRVHAHPGAGAEGVGPSAVETPHTRSKSEQQRRILDCLNAAEAFEGFVHEVPRAEALQPRRRREPDPDARRVAQRAAATRTWPKRCSGLRTGAGSTCS